MLHTRQMEAWRSAIAFDGRRFLPDGATVLVEDGLIVGVEPMAYDVPHDCPVTELTGTLLPGLVDAHVHLVSDGGLGSLERVATLDADEVDAQVERSLRAQAAAGVTTVRDLGDIGYRTLAFRDRAEPGLPRVVAAGPPITSPGGHCHYLGCTAESPAELEVAVRDHHERGTDVVKVMASGGFLTPGTDVLGAQFAVAQLQALVEQAHQLGLPVLAHAHSLTGIEVSLAAGVDGIEHFSGVTDHGVDLPDELLDRVAAAGVLVDPTMGNDMSLVPLLPPPPPQIAELMARLGTDMVTVFEQRYRDVARMRAHGVRVVPGVDAGAMPLKAHGNAWIAVTDLVRAAYPVDEALAAGTSGAADACGVGDATGALRAGLAADLLAVDGDLRSDPAALGRPVAVVVRGECVLTPAP